MKKQGLWFLPNSDIKVPGKLFVDEDKSKIRLRLFAETYISGNPFEFLKSKRDDDYIEFIYGENDKSSFGQVTLFGCSFSKLSHIGGDIHQLEYSIQFVFEDIHIISRKHLQLNNLTVLFPNSDNFFNGWDSVSDEGEKEVKEYRRKSNTIVINHNLSVDSINEKREKISSGKDYAIEYHHHFNFNYKEPVDIDTVYQDCVVFKKMMEFSSSRKLAFIIRGADIDFKNIKEQRNRYVLSSGKKPAKARTYIFSRLTLNQAPFEEKRKLHQNWLLFSKWSESNETLDSFIKEWFANVELQPIYDIYIDTIDWGKDGVISNVSFNNRFLNVMQALEAYYDFLNPDFKIINEEFVKQRQEVINALEAKNLKEWVRTHSKFPKHANFSIKLSFLIDKYRDVLLSLGAMEEFLKSYPNSAKEFRHKLSHGKVNKTFQGKALDSLYRFSQIILSICILDSIGMEKTRIVDRIKTNPDMLRQIPK